MPRHARITTIAVLAASTLLVAGGATAGAAGRTTAAMKLTPAQPAVGATLTLDGSRSKCAAKPCRYQWTTQSKGKRAVKVASKAKATLKLTAAGSFVVTLKVTDKRKRTATTRRTLTVAAAPVVSPPPPLAAPPAPPTVTLAAKPPTTPVISTPAEGALLSSSTVTIAGSVGAGTVVSVREGATTLATAPVDGSGAWSLVLTGVSDGTHAFVARAADAAGAASPDSPARTVRIDTVAPAVPAITAPAADVLLATDRAQLAGTAEPGAVVELFDGAVSRGKTTAGGDGAWTMNLQGLADGAHAFTARATDAAGNTSGASTVRGLRVDTRAPAAPVIVTPAPDAVLNTTSVTVSGTAEAGADVELFNGAASLGSVRADQAGAWSRTIDELSDGDHAFTARATDAAGHTGVASSARVLRIDTLAPEAPAITAPGEDSLHASATVTLSGTAESGTTVEVFEGDASRGTATAVNGAWSATVSHLSDGAHAFTAKARDAAGNVSKASSARGLRVDTQAPATPAITQPADDSLLATGTVLFVGTGEPDAELELSVGQVRASAFIDAHGDWSAQISELTDGPHTISAVAVDKAGNRSPASAARTLRIDTVAPDTKLVSVPPSTVGVDAVEFEFSGGETYECRLDRPGPQPGEWEACTSPMSYSALKDGDHGFRVRAIDEAGNVDATPGEHAFSVRLQPGGAAQVFVAVDGDDLKPCTAEAPCKSLRRAFAVAEDGAVIEVAAGLYGDGDLPRGEKQVTVRGAAGTRPEFRYLDVWTDDVTVRRLKVEKLNVRGSRQTYDDIDVDAKFEHHVALEHWDGDHNTFKNGRIGNVTDEKGALVGEQGWTFDNVEFHDVLVTDPLVHNECFYATGAQGLTVRNSTFHDCATMDIFFTNYAGGGPYGNITIENNVFEHTNMETPGSWHYYTMGIHDAVGELNNWVVRHNTFETGVSSGPRKGTGRWVGNLGDWDCIEGFQYRYNVGQACSDLDSGVFPSSSTKERPAAFDWVDPGKRDFRLKPTSPALDNADPEDFPPTDRNGNPRPQGWGPDAGALESG